MESLLITQNINNRKTYGFETDYSKGWLIKRNAKDKYSPQVSSEVQLSEIPHRTEASQFMYSRSESTGSYRTQALTER